MMISKQMGLEMVGTHRLYQRKDVSAVGVAHSRAAGRHAPGVSLEELRNATGQSGTDTERMELPMRTPSEVALEITSVRN